MDAERSSGSSSSSSQWQHGWLSRRVQQTIEMSDPIYSRKRKRREPAFFGNNLFPNNLHHTTGQLCILLVYRSAAEARLWLFMTSRRLSS